MSITISIINNKGGVGKTTSTTILAELLAFAGKKVLIVDTDDSSNVSMQFHSFAEDSPAVLKGWEAPKEQNIAELFKFRYHERDEVKNLIKETPVAGVHIIPSSRRHKDTPDNIIRNTGNNNIILKKALNTVKDDYDYVLIDNAPSSSILTVNSMFASDYILVPVRMEGFSYKGLKETIDSIAYIKEEHELENAKFLGVFMTQTENQTNIFKDLKDEYETDLADKFFKTPIRKDIKVYEIETRFEPILKHAPNTNAVFDYSHLLLETGILDQKGEEILKHAIGE